MGFWGKKGWARAAQVAAVLSVTMIIASGCGKVATASPVSAASPAADTAEVPPVTGMSGSEARSALEAAGLTVDWGGTTVIAASNWTVDAQRPAAGEHATRGSTVVLTVSKHQKATPTPTSTPTATTAPAPAQPAAPAEPAPAAPPSAAPAPVEEAPAPEQPRNVYYANCAAARAAGAAPIYEGQPGYSRKLDRDGDGIACE